MRTSRSILFIAILGVALSACGSAAQLAPVSGETTGSAAGRDGVALDPNGPPVPAQPAVGEGEGGGDTGGNAIGKVDDARIIRTGSMDLEVSDVPAAVKAARSAILAMGGYVGASNAGMSGDTPYAEIAYRVPADRWEDALAALRGLDGLTTKVVSEQTQAVEVTAQVVDLEARIRNLEASERALQDIAAKATKVSDVLEIQAQLTNVRGEIEQLTAQLKDLDDRASYATLSARYSVAVVAVQAAAKGWEPATTIDQASASLISTLQSLTDAGIWFVIVWLPILLVVAILAGIGVAIARRMGFRRREASPPAAPMPPADLPTAI